MSRLCKKRRRNENLIGDATTNHKGRCLSGEESYLGFCLLGHPAHAIYGARDNRFGAGHYRLHYGHRHGCQWGGRSGGDCHCAASGDELGSDRHDLRHRKLYGDATASRGL